MFKKSLLLVAIFALCFSFAGTSAYAKDQLQTRDRLKTCDQFVDEDGDGICDNCDGVDCDGDGICDNDCDGDGVCDQFVDEDGDGICDNCDCTCDECQCENQKRAGR